MLRVDCATGATTTTATNEMQAAVSVWDYKLGTLSGYMLLLERLVMSEAEPGLKANAPAQARRSGK